MLIDSERLTARDRAHWERLAHYDDVLSQIDAERLNQMADRGRQAIETFAAQGPCYTGTSWGKDSTTVAHLLATSAATHVPLIWMRTRDYENPDCFTVRDAFLTQHPHMADRYHEIISDASTPRWWETAGEGLPTVPDALPSGLKDTQARWGQRYISGIRAEESCLRKMSIGRHGAVTKLTCKPIATWSTTDVFAYLHKENLPVHPAYAQTMGGHYDRQRLRVATLGGIRGGTQGRAEWEAHYYPDIVGRRAP